MVGAIQIAVSAGQRPHMVEKGLCVFFVLIVQAALIAAVDDEMRFDRKACEKIFRGLLRPRRWCLRHARRGCCGGRHLSARGGEAIGISLQACRDGFARTLDRILEMHRVDVQHVRACQRSQHHRIDHRSGVLRGLLHVKDDGAFGKRMHRLEGCLRVKTAIGHHHLFGCGVNAMAGRQQCGAIRTEKAVLRRARGFDQFGGHHHIHPAGNGGEGKDGAPCANFLHRNFRIFDVIGGGAGSLRDAGNRCALHQIAGGPDSRDGPVGEHASAFAAKCRDEDGSCPGWFCRHVPPRSVLQIADHASANAVSETIDETRILHDIGLVE